MNKVDNIFFLGIGGIGMSALARFYKTEGFTVSGYDLTPSIITQDLEKEGIDIIFDDNRQLVKKLPDLVIYTPAVPIENDIFRYFVEKQVTMIKRAVALGEITKRYYTVAVAGTHGKTTITSLIAHILKYNNRDVTAFVGGVCRNYDSNLILSNPTKIVVVEADEFDRSFLTLQPDIAVISSMDADHLDIYKSKDYLHESFNLFASKIKSGGALYAHEDLPVSVENHAKKYEFSFEGATPIRASNLKIVNGRTTFTIKTEDGSELRISTFLPGIHNVTNISVAASVCKRLGLSETEIEEALVAYKGVWRRFDVRVRNQKIVYIDDYAHHPAEIAATLKAVRMLFPDRKITTVFQPHLFSRTRDFAEEFAASLSLSDELFLMPIYPAREKPMEGVTSEWLLEMVTTKKQMTDFDLVVDDVINSKPEVLLTLGAGSIDRIVEPFEKAFL